LEDRHLLTALSIYEENQLTGSPREDWDVGFGSTAIEGFATKMSVDQGETIEFKIKTAEDYHIEIYRTGYYNDNGARYITTINDWEHDNPDFGLSDSQPTAFVDESLGMADAGNWHVTAHWDVPSDATSGVYLANLVISETEKSQSCSWCATTTAHPTSCTRPRTRPGRPTTAGVASHCTRTVRRRAGMA
jgi:hypothetical protein